MPQYLGTKEKVGEAIVADSVRGAAEYITKIFKVGHGSSRYDIYVYMYILYIVLEHRRYRNCYVLPGWEERFLVET